MSSIYVSRDLDRKKVILGLGGTISMEEWGRVLDKDGNVVYKEVITDWHWMSETDRKEYKLNLFDRCVHPDKAEAQIVNNPYYSAHDVHEHIKEAVEMRYSGSGLTEMRRIIEGSDIKFEDLHLEPDSESPGIDSSDMNFAYCSALAKKAFEYMVRHDSHAVGVLQGTDTEDQTIRVLSFMLHGMREPFIGTGAMSIIRDPETDAIKNYKGMLVTLDYDLPLPMWMFNQQLMGYELLKKVGTRKGYRFVPNGLCFATNKNGKLDFDEADMRARNLLRRQRQVMEKFFQSGPEVYPDYANVEQAHMRFEYRPAEIEGWLREGIRYGIIASYPDGNVPRNVVRAIGDFTDNGGLLMIAPQEGTRVSGAYGAGADALNAGAIRSYGMPLMLARAKLAWAAGQTNDREELKRLLKCPFIGETDAELEPKQIDDLLEEGYKILRGRKKERLDQQKDKTHVETLLTGLVSGYEEATA